MDAAEIIVVGGCIIDLVSYVQRFPYPGETLIGSKFHRAFGGKGANQCDMVSKLCAPSAMIAKVGNDSFGQEFIEHFKSCSIHSKHVTIENASHTSTANITVTQAGENQIVNVFGAIDFLSSNDIMVAAKDLFPQGKLLVCTYEGPKESLLEALKLAKQYSLKTLVNAAPLGDDHYKELFPFTDIICVNETEAGILCGLKVSTIEEATIAAKILIKQVNEGVILTLGENGAIYCTKDSPEPNHVSAPKVKAVDSTGAGDCFNGSLAYYMIHHANLPLKEIIRRSCIIASYSVQGEGTQQSFPHRSKLPLELFQ